VETAGAVPWKHRSWAATSRRALPQRLIHSLTALPPFQSLLDEHASDVMAVLRGAVGRTDAEDCFQETFLAALGAYPGLDNTSNLRGWLLTIAHRKAVDHHRASGRRPLPVGEAGEIEAGGALGCSPEAARRSLHEGLKRLRAELAATESAAGKERS